MSEKINFVYTKSFKKQWKKIGLTLADRDYMEKLLQDFANGKDFHVGKAEGGCLERE